MTNNLITLFFARCFRYFVPFRKRQGYTKAYIDIAKLQKTQIIKHGTFYLFYLYPIVALNLRYSEHVFALQNGILFARLT